MTYRQSETYNIYICRDKRNNREKGVNIGIKVFSPKDLKIVRGKRLPVTVLQQSTYAALLEQAIQKWNAYDKNFDRSKEFVLLCDDDRCAQFMPGRRNSYIINNTCCLVQEHAF